MKKVLLILAIILAVVGLGFVCYGFYQKLTTNIPNPVATMEIDGYGTVKIELYPDKAPNTVANFIALANKGFYDGLTFHRTIPDFMIQGGDISGNGSGSPKLSSIIDIAEDQDKEYNIPGEFIANGYTQNNLKHERGVISMARTDYGSFSSELRTYGYNSAGSQFFIMTEDNTSLDGLYAAFGKVIEGMDIVDKIANTEVNYRDDNAPKADDKGNVTYPKDANGNDVTAPNTPKEKPVISHITVETYGVNYGTPKTLDIFDYYSWMLQNYSYSY